MSIIAAVVHVGEDGASSGRAPHGMPPGEHIARIEVPPTSAKPPRGKFAIGDLPHRGVGPWPEGFRVGREEIHDEGGR